MPRDIQEVLFETAMKGHDADARNSRACCPMVTHGPCTRRSLPKDGRNRGPRCVLNANR
jgi:hypothetical protein